MATHFADEEGMILEMQNDGRSSGQVPFLNVKWLSRYREEDERLWMHVDKGLRLVSIRDVDNKTNYQTIIHALYLFDAMLNGSPALGNNVTITDKDVSNESIVITQGHEYTIEGEIVDFSFKKND